MPIVISQSRNGKVVIRALANESYIVVGNTSVSNLISNDDTNQQLSANGGIRQAPYQNTANVYVNGAHITDIMWVTTGEIQILRGANIVYDLYGAGEFHLRHWGMASNNAAVDYTSANLVINFASGNGTILLEVQKDTSFTSEY
jgi:hypothetical protein